jgi:hypothetical protein
MERPMRAYSSIIRAQLSAMLLLLFFAVPSFAAPEGKIVPKLEVNGSVIVRFSFKPPNSNFVRPALIFRVADEGSANWNTAPIDRLGRSAYISIAEMKSLVQHLGSSRVSWRESEATHSIEPFEELPVSENVLVTIYASNGIATASIPAKDICGILSGLNSLIQIDRAHWEFEYFRRGCGCKVLGYKADKYPNDR